MPLNIGALLLDNPRPIRPCHCMTPPAWRTPTPDAPAQGPALPIEHKTMTQIRTLLLAAATAAAALTASPALAECYADYRAKMDNPLRLHYGILELPANACSVGAAAPVIASRIAQGGWELLQVVSVFDESGLTSRRADAGDYFLRF